jgi:hypothetical protein
MLSKGQHEVQRIIKSFLHEYESLRERKATSDELINLYERVRRAFCSNVIIKNDSITSQPLGTCQYSENYLKWLRKNGKTEEIESKLGENFPITNFPHREVRYRSGDKLGPAYEGGVKWDSTISCLFGLAQGKRLEYASSGLWDSNYYEAIQLWEGGSGGHHRLLSHILFGSNNINPYRLDIIRNDFVDPALNEALCHFDELFDDLNSKNGSSIGLAFNVDSLTQETTAKIRNFFHDVTDKEKKEMARVINAIKPYAHQYISGSSWTKEIEIENMYSLLDDIRRIKSKPRWYRKLLILKQKLLGIRTVDPITCSVLELRTWKNPYWKNSELNDRGLLCYLPGLRDLLLAIFK